MESANPKSWLKVYPLSPSSTVVGLGGEVKQEESLRVQLSHCPLPLSQCKPSRGRKRGICWCVDKYGMKLPGMEYVDGDFQCHAFDSSNVE